jgi:hypothetical protein
MPRVQNSNLNTRSAPYGFIAAQYFQCVEIWLPTLDTFRTFLATNGESSANESTLRSLIALFEASLHV